MSLSGSNSARGGEKRAGDACALVLDRTRSIREANGEGGGGCRWDGVDGCLPLELPFGEGGDIALLPPPLPLSMRKDVICTVECSGRTVNDET